MCFGRLTMPTVYTKRRFPVTNSSPHAKRLQGPHGAGLVESLADTQYTVPGILATIGPGAAVQQAWGPLVSPRLQRASQGSWALVGGRHGCMHGGRSMQALRDILAYLCVVVVPILQNPLTGGIDRVVALEVFGLLAASSTGPCYPSPELIYPHRCSSSLLRSSTSVPFHPFSYASPKHCLSKVRTAPLSRASRPVQSTLPAPAQSVTMPAILESAVPQPPHLHLSTASPWSPYNSHCYGSSASSPTPMTPESLTTFVPRLHDSPLPSQEAAPSSNWFGTSVSAPDAQNEVRLHAHMPRWPC